MIKIFVSSTFKDMDYERDILHDEIVPELNEYASQYGEQVELCDLRWGIDTTGYDEVEGSKKILSVCLDEIERCNPYMVVLLGNRYGWVPDKKYVSDIDLQAEYYDKSVTELEIQYGALARNNPNALFYFRELDGVIPPEYESEDTDSAGKLKRLKQDEDKKWRRKTIYNLRPEGTQQIKENQEYIFAVIQMILICILSP